MAGPVLYHLGKFPPTAFDWPQLIPLIGPGNAALARYDGLLSAMKIPGATARRILTLVSGKGGLLKKRLKGRGRRSAVYAFRELLNIAEGREVF
jgi:hypothetical protein